VQASMVLMPLFSASSSNEAFSVPGLNMMRGSVPGLNIMRAGFNERI